jgi:hypothetical protein
LFTEELSWRKGRDLELVMGEAACNWLGWPLPAAPGVEAMDGRDKPYGCPIHLLIIDVPFRRS